jgi:hypothetical protein
MSLFIPVIVPSTFNEAAVIGASDIDGTITLGNGTYDANGSFDATGGTIDMTSTGRLQVSGAVTSFGTLDVAAGTVEYDGGTQDVIGGQYYNLEIDAAGTKSITLGTAVLGTRL